MVLYKTDIFASGFGRMAALVTEITGGFGETRRHGFAADIEPIAQFEELPGGERVDVVGMRALVRYHWVDIFIGLGGKGLRGHISGQEDDHRETGRDWA